MTRQEIFLAVFERMRKPENCVRYHNYSLHPQKSDIWLKWYFERARKGLVELQKSTARDESAELLESDFDVSICKVNEILNEQGWE